MKTIASGALLASTPPLLTSARAEESPSGWAPDPIGGYVKTPPRACLFTDHRLIDPSDLWWANPEGKGLPLTEPPLPVVDAHAMLRNVPHGIRCVAQPARVAPVDGDPNVAGQIVNVEGMYCSIPFRVEYPPGRDLGVHLTVAPTAVLLAASKSKDLRTARRLDPGRLRGPQTGGLRSHRGRQPCPSRALERQRGAGDRARPDRRPQVPVAARGAVWLRVGGMIRCVAP